jgi:hypothetical protein
MEVEFMDPRLYDYLMYVLPEKEKDEKEYDDKSIAYVGLAGYYFMRKYF